MATLTSVVLAPVVEAWVTGGNDYEELGLGDTTYRNTPEQLSSPTNVVQVAAGGLHTVFVDASGTVCDALVLLLSRENLLLVRLLALFRVLLPEKSCAA
jgi:hypothetical protein